MRAQGRPVSMLHPFRESFYERLGYVAAGAALEIEAPTAALGHYLERKPQPGWVEERLAPAEAREAFQALLRETAPHYNGFTVHERVPAAKWESRTRDWLFVMIRRDGVLHAAARYEKLGNPNLPLLRVRDPYWRDLAGRNALLRFLAKHRDQVAAVNLQVPYGSAVHSWFRDTMSPFGIRIDEKPWMVRVVDVAPALEGLPAQPDGRITVEVTDDRCPWNDGRFTLEAAAGRLKAAPAARGAVEARLDQKALASLVYGSRSVEEVCDLGWMDRQVELLDRWFPATPFYNTLSF
jgi:predicted acetyltransferase